MFLHLSLAVDDNASYLIEKEREERILFVDICKEFFSRDEGNLKTGVHELYHQTHYRFHDDRVAFGNRLLLDRLLRLLQLVEISHQERNEILNEF
jgi:hypothetical protein